MMLQEAPSPFVAFKYRDFRLYQTTRLFTTIGTQMQSVVVGWQVYEITHNPLDLGFIGLVQFLPAILVSLVSGHVADRFDRRRILLATNSVMALCALLLFIIATHAGTGIGWIYAVLVLYGTARGFNGPAASALMPSLVPVRDFSNAVAWSSTIWQIATIVGPAAGGLLYGVVKGAAWVYLAALGLIILGLISLASLRSDFATLHNQTPEPHAPSEAPEGRQLLAGIRYVWQRKVILGAISLDLFAVLLGGATALLPVYARDILHAGPLALGLMRSAPSMGAAIMAVLLAYRPLRKRAGRKMFAGVFVFGVATCVFGLSRNFWLSMFALAVLGAADMISVVVRHTVVQLMTPARMRGRVSAVNQVFIGASNELGEFESGLTAAWFGTVPAVLVGGIGTCLVVVLWSLMFPALRQVDELPSGPK